MYIVLNYKLNFNEQTNSSDFYEICVDSDKDIISDMYDIIELSNIVENNYSLGESIYVYCIKEETLNEIVDEFKKKRIYKFQVKSYVKFKILKESSKHQNKNQFMMYKFCSTIDKLISENKWDKCVDGLIETLDYKSLLKVSEYLKYTPKNSDTINHITSAVKKIENTIVIKSFDIKDMNICDIVKLLNSDVTNKNLLISRLKSHIYDEIDLNTLEKEINYLIEISHIDLLRYMYKDYLNKLIVLNYNTDDSNKKDYLLKSNAILDEISFYIDKENNNLSEQFNSIFKQNKRLF